MRWCGIGWLAVVALRMEVVVLWGGVRRRARASIARGVGVGVAAGVVGRVAAGRECVCGCCLCAVSFRVCLACASHVPSGGLFVCLFVCLVERDP